MYDVIVVGARVAGAPTAMLLARKGYKVLLVDKSTFPSDILSSTLLIWPPGIALLQHWGVLEQFQASQCPPITRYRAYLGAPFDNAPALIIDGAPTPTPLEGMSTSYAPRRTVLDKLLVDAAIAAGATLYEGFTVNQALLEEGRVVGIRGQTQTGAPVMEQATLVVGADGANSIVARTVAAAEYKTHDPIVLTYYAYWQDVALADGVQLEFCPQDWCAAYAWPTHDGHLLIGTNWARALTEIPPQGAGFTPRSTDWHTVFAEVAQNVDASYMRILAQCAPWLADQCRSGGTRESALAGGWVRSFYRKPFGPGWALVGDAGSSYEFTTAHGIMNAFREAQFLAEAVDDGLSGRNTLPEALADYEQRRNAAGFPYSEFTIAATTYQPAPDPEAAGALYAAIAQNSDATADFWGLFAQTMLPGEFFSEQHVRTLLQSNAGG
jgi:flavin-dependent dehydrogenase